jgi:HlyD family type I secretion membrane fusion protein
MKIDNFAGLLARRRPDIRSYTEPRRPALVGAAVIAGFIAVLTLWSATAPVSGAAIASGSLQVEGRRQAVQHPYGGVIKSLNIREGERVEKGQVLMTLFDSEPGAKLEVLQAERDAALAREARLVAERDGHDELSFPVELTGRDDDGARQAMANARALLAARKHQFETERDVLYRQIGQFREQIEGLRAQVRGAQTQHELLVEEKKGAEQLLASGAGTKIRVLSLQRDLARVDSEHGARQADIAGLDQKIAQTELEIAKLSRTRLSEITDELRAVQSTLAELKPKLDAARDVVARTKIRAPATGAVVGLDVFTEGGVIQPGAKLLDVVPTGNPLVVQARLPLSAVDQVAPGQEADVRLTGINYVERPHLSGTLETVSADRVNDDKSGQAFYTVEVALRSDDVKRSNIALQAGMPVEVILPTRPRTLMQYLLGPLRDEIAGAFRER